MEKIFVRSRNEWGFKESAPGPHVGMFYRVRFDNQHAGTSESRLIDTADTGFNVGDRIAFNCERGTINRVSNDGKIFWAAWDNPDVFQGDVGIAIRQPLRLEGGFIQRAPTVSTSAAVSKYHTAASTVASLVQQKNAKYGDSFGKSGEVMRQLYPEGIKADQLDDALTVVRILDKLFRIATDKDAFGENPFQDIAGYSILAMARGDKK